MTLVYLNGELVPAESARISIFDRGFLYGDGVFETVRVQAGQPRHWREHLARLERSVTLARLTPREPLSGLKDRVIELIAANHCPDAVLRITLSRGAGARGYSPAGAGPGTLALSLHPLPAPTTRGLRVIISTLRLVANDPLATAKSANRLRQVLARAEADDAGADDALLLNERGELTEATGSNVFWIAAGKLCTPPASAGLLPGVTRAVLLRLAPDLGLTPAESNLTPSAVADVEGMFLANVISGPVTILSVEGRELRQSSKVAEIRKAIESEGNGPTDRRG